ncbi:sensor histidine kinase [Algoriphagus machipongonensis]|uniref:histidine kinase n=1 Tax=Algoriphagus machipongonensis TaxID=388413 RepID=A3HV40_9BACT|nr:sensor histidine kinase [Algoriphagus machipongonensis]EAZ82012.1 sensor histidine kinase [Algoriphagus machipongonensis]
MKKINTYTNFLKFRALLVLTPLFLLASTFFSQAQNYIFNNITSDDGLPSTSVTDVTQDIYGFIYLGTWDGVYRFDGKDYEKIFYQQGRYVEADDKGGVWIEVQNGNLFFYDSNLDTLISYMNVDPNRRFIQVLLGMDGEVFAATSKGIMKLDSASNNFVLEPGQDDGEVLELNIGEDGRINFILIPAGSEEQKIGKRHPDGKFSYEEFPLDENTPNKPSFSDSYTTIIFPYGKSGTVLFNSNGIASRESDKDAWTFKKVSDPEILQEKVSEIDASYLLLENELWLNQINAISTINLETGESTTIQSGTNIQKELLPTASNHGSRLFLDGQGVLWIPKFAYGISLLNTYQSDFGLLRDEQGKVIPDILSSYELSDGSFWAGQRISNEKGLIHFASDRKTILHRIGGFFGNFTPGGKTTGTVLSHPFAWAITQTEDSTLWVGTGSPGYENGGLNRIDPKTGLITRYKNDPEDSTSLSNNWISGIYKDPQDKLWLNLSNGIDFFDPESETFTSIVKGNKDVYYRAALIDSKGNFLIQKDYAQSSWLLIDTDSKAIVKNGNFFNKDLGYITAMPILDSQGRIWIASVDGFGYFDENYDGLKVWKTYEEFGFPDLEIRAFSFDDQGNLYLASSEGIIQYHPESGKTVRFGSERGLQSNLFETKQNNRGPSGRIYFSGNGGMNVFDPKEIKTNPYPPKIIIRGITLDGKSYQTFLDSTDRKPNHTFSSLTIPPGITTLSINFASIHLGGSGKNNTQYRLLNFDDNWQDAGGNGNAVFTNLPAGDYILELKSSNLDGIWSIEPFQLSIKVLPPWYQTWWAYVLYFSLFVILSYAFIKEQSRRAAKKERDKVRDRELAQAKEIEKAYSELKSTQAQLIQSEKMASLGELTAGIAHEIQNPLNFVNNFSEVSEELVDEMNEELEKGEIEEAKFIGKDLKENLSKINHHGKRADAIVKGMLEHSRANKGEKVLTDLNALADEFVRLSYHGLRAKDKSFNADFKLELDPDLPKVNMVAPDIGRVILNLVNNAFYAVNEKAKSGSDNQIDEGYQPEVTVKTTVIKSPSGDLGVELSVKDNGNGIPDSVKKKIFQPFFTTKPTGSGTGLGLSLSYDIVKAHGGELKVESMEGLGCKFIVQFLLIA